MHFIMQDLITPNEDLAWMEEPFEQQEVDDIIKHLPTDKSHGPNGFNGNFIKKMLAYH